MTSLSILLPTRGRTDSLKKSIASLLDLADSPEQLEFRIGFDTDDQESFDHFRNHVVPMLDQKNVSYTVVLFKPMGYNNLHHYVNTLAQAAQGDWFIFWNDDAVMQSQGWDTEIRSHTGSFVIQAFATHNMHPYSIFPIVPKAWHTLLGFLSEHPLNDAYISQIAWMLDIMKRIPVQVLHDRADLTGNNKDSTFAHRNLQALEGNVNNPSDINHLTCRHKRYTAAVKLANYMRDQNIDTSHFDESVAGSRDPWCKMMAADINGQITRVA